jgi:hypothetical protein
LRVRLRAPTGEKPMLEKTFLGTNTSGATARSQGEPQARTPMRVLEDLIDYTQHYDLQIKVLIGGPRALWLKGYMYEVNQSFIDKVAEKGWRILAITADPQGVLEVSLIVKVAPDNTPTTQPNVRKGGVGGDEWSDGA